MSGAENTWWNTKVHLWCGLLGCWAEQAGRSNQLTWRHDGSTRSRSCTVLALEHALQFQMIKWIHFTQAPVNFCTMFYCLCTCVKTVYLIQRRQRHNTIFNSHVFCLFIYSVSQHTWTAVFFFFCSHAYICICSSVWFDCRILEIGIHHSMKGVEKLTLNWFQMNNSASKLEGWNWPNSGHCIWNKHKRTNAWNTTVLIAKGYQLIHWMKHWNKPLWHCKIPLKGYYKFPRREEGKEKNWIPRVRKA